MKTKILGGFRANLTLKIKVKSSQTRLRSSSDRYLVQVEGKIQNASKVITFTRNHTDDDEDADEDGTKNNMSRPGRGGET